MPFLVEGNRITEVEEKPVEVWVPGMSVEVRSVGSSGPFRKVPEYKLRDTRAEAEQDIRDWQKRRKQSGLPVVRGHGNEALLRRCFGGAGQ